MECRVTIVTEPHGAGAPLPHNLLPQGSCPCTCGAQEQDGRVGRRALSTEPDGGWSASPWGNTPLGQSPKDLEVELPKAAAAGSGLQAQCGRARVLRLPQDRGTVRCSQATGARDPREPRLHPVVRKRELRPRARPRLRASVCGHALPAALPSFLFPLLTMGMHCLGTTVYAGHTQPADLRSPWPNGKVPPRESPRVPPRPVLPARGAAGLGWAGWGWGCQGAMMPSTCQRG